MIEQNLVDKLIIKEGKFYRGDTIIKAEHGNLEQIACLNENNRFGEVLKEGLIVCPDYDNPTEIDAWVYFDCICGQRLRKTVTVLEEGDIDNFIDATIHCDVCSRNYVFEENEDSELIVKLTK